MRDERYFSAKGICPQSTQRTQSGAFTGLPRGGQFVSRNERQQGQNGKLAAFHPVPLSFAFFAYFADKDALPLQQTNDREFHVTGMRPYQALLARDLRLAFRRRADLLLPLGFAVLVVLLFGALAIRLLVKQVRIAAALRDSQIKAEAANRMKSEFLASMSHELRTPLNGIMGYAEFLKDSADETNREFAGIIFDSSNHLLELVNSILDLAKIESGKMELALRTEPLRPMIERIVLTHRPPADRKGLALALHIEPGTPDEVVCDPTRVAQILNNLLNNAVKFTDAGSVTVQVGQEEGKLRITVADTGCGIESGMQPHVFERFRQVDGFLTRRHQGTGRGLALVKELVELMGGEVTLSSRPAQGSEFSITLPLAPQTMAPGKG